MKKLSNSEFASTDSRFKDACRAVNLEPSKRQASKWRMKKGLAYNIRTKEV